jgi:uncharacterized protein (TIGR03435 family)
MRVLFGRFAVAALLSTGLIAQSSSTASFDVADVHVRPHSTNPLPVANGGFIRDGRYNLRNATMLDLISRAYGVNPDTVLGGPNWLARTRFDIIAKASDGTPAETLQLMLQSMLSDRFKLALHKDTRPVPAFILTVSGTPKMKAGTPPAGDDADKQACQAPTTPPAPTSTGVPFGALSCRAVTMEAFAQLLPSVAAAYVSTRVVNQTGLKGNWDFDIKWSPRAALTRAGSEGITLSAALEQLGLKVDYGTAPAPVLVVDSVNEAPTPNPSGTAQNLPAPPPAEFDVADIKIAASDAQVSFRIQTNGRLDAQGVTMKMLFQAAWDVNDDQLVANAPKWFDTTKYSLVAKASSIGNDPRNPNNVQIDIDDTKAMLRALLTERFKIVTHIEQRPVDAYTLVVADKPKLQAADPANRTKRFEGVLPGVKDPREANPALSRIVTVQDMTMAQFAEELSSIAPGYFRLPVIDATGIAGAFDFVLSFSPVGAANNTQGGTGGSGALAASAPTGALSLLDALPKELGLKLEQVKRTLPVIVIDHIEEQPIDR